MVSRETLNPLLARFRPEAVHTKLDTTGRPFGIGFIWLGRLMLASVTEAVQTSKRHPDLRSAAAVGRL